MNSIKNKFIKLSKATKITCLVFLILTIILISISIPSLARHKNRNILITTTTWDGNVASSYRKGTGIETDPYVISNASELAYLSLQLKTTDYKDTYFILNNDIVLNNGIFTYDQTDGITYTKDEITSYIKPYTTEYYDNTNREGTKTGDINTINPLNNFKGHLDGNSFRIYGLYISSETEKLGLFTNLNGNIKNLYVENSIIYGGNITGGIASDTIESNMNNILYNGFVIGEDTEIQKTITATLTDQIIIPTNIEEQTTLDLTLENKIFGEIVSITLTGNLAITDTNNGYTMVKINDTEIILGEFEIDLGQNIISNTTIKALTYSNDVTINLTNLNYSIVYNIANAGGIIGNSDKTILENVINKSYTYGHLISGGIVGIATDTSINRTYNNGNIESTSVSGGLIGKIEGNTSDIAIFNSYNAGSVVSTNIGGLVGFINNNQETINITNSFEATSMMPIHTITSSMVNVDNSYYTSTYTNYYGTYSGTFNIATLDNLKDKDYVITNLLFNEFIDNEDILENSDNVWLYEELSLPILYIDDLANPIARIYTNNYTWDNLSFELTKENTTSNVAFSIEILDSLKKPSIYYYIHNSETPLLRNEIEEIDSWLLYDGITEITQEGPNIIYVKIVDGTTITYINSDIIMLDKTGPAISINMNSKTWNALAETLDNLYIDDSKTITIEAIDNVSGLLSLEYYISDNALTELELKELDTWETYENSILLTELGNYIIYAKAIDNFDNVSFTNTDNINYNGYILDNLTYGRNGVEKDNVSITDKSSISFTSSYEDNNACIDCSHNLVSNILLPQGTLVTLIDNSTLKTYTYKIETADDIYGYEESCSSDDCVKVATYPFTLFKEVGKNTITNFTEQTGIINDNYKIILDFADTNINTNYENISTYLELKNNESTRFTIKNSLKTFNIYSTIDYQATNASLYLNVLSPYININSDSATDVSISSGLSYKYLSDVPIYDTTYEDKKIGLAIRMIDVNGNVIDKQNFKNIIFTMNGKEYYPNNDNMVRINLESNNDITKNLTITTTSDNMFINEGTYYFEISNYISYDGMFPDEFYNTKYIPVSITNTNYSDLYGFNVTMDDEDRVIVRSNENTNILFNLLQSGYIYEPSVRVSLYQKTNLRDATNQDYTLIDLNTYVVEELAMYDTNIYTATVNNFNDNSQVEKVDSFEINLITQDLEKTGYKFVFELYNGNQKISTIEKKFIIR